MVDRTITTDLIGRDRLSPAFNSAGQAADQAGSKVKAFAKGAAAVGGAAGAGAAGLFAKGFSDNMSIEVGNDKLRGQLGLSAADAARAGDVAAAAYGDNFGESIDEVNGAIKAVGSNLSSVSKTSSADLQSMTEKALALASTFEVDVNASTNAASQLIKNGLAKDATEAFDLITAGYQSGANKADDFLDTLQEYGPQFQKLGMDGPQALGLLNQGLSAGARNTDIIADAFKEFSLRAIDGSALTVDAYKSLGLSANDYAAAIAKGGPAANKATAEIVSKLQAVKDPVEKNRIGVELFGTQWEDLGAKAFDALDLTAAKTTEVKGKTDEMSAAVGDNAAAKIETMKRAFQGWTQSMASSEGPLGLVVTGVGQFGGGAIDAAGSVGMMAAGLRGTAVAEKGMAVATAILNGGLKAMRVATTLALGPFGLIVIAVAAVAAGLIYAYKHSDKFRAVTNAAFKATATVVLTVVDKVLWGFQQMASAAGHLPGKLGAPFRAAAIGIQSARDKVNGLRADLNKVRSKSVKLTVTTVFYQKGKEPGTYGNGLGVLRAKGGPVAKGQSYVVGDGGRPELFVPDQDGTILPRVPSEGTGRAWAGGSGGGDTYVFHISGVVAGSHSELADTVVKALERRPAGSRKIPASAIGPR